MSLEDLLLGLGINASYDVIKNLAKSLGNDLPFRKRLEAVTTLEEAESVIRQKLFGVYLEAKDGNATIDGATISAVGEFFATHQNGCLDIQHSNIQTDGAIIRGTGAGRSSIHDEVSISVRGGSSVHFGKGAGMFFTGNAGIELR